LKTSTQIIISVCIGIAVFNFLNSILGINFFEGFSKIIFDTADTIAEYLGKYNTKRLIERIKRNRIVIQKESIYAKYNRLVEAMIYNFNLPLTLESFTSLLCICFAVVAIIIVTIMRSISLSITLTISIFTALITYFVMKSKMIQSEKLESIMDAEDLICPLARNGVLNAIKKVMESDEYINPNIRPYFEQFIDNCENNGYSFRQAMTILNRQLGPKFDNFAKKAIIFEYNERKGMADVFLDIVDENAVLREINSKKERIFNKMNRDFLIKTIIIILFFLYALSVEGFKTFMLESNIGRIINTLLVSTICLSFAKCQALQGDFGTGGENK